MYTQFWSGNLKKRDNLEDLGIDTILIKFEKYGQGKNSIQIAQDSEQRLEGVNTATNLRVP
jgi:hypothetical protein